MSIHPSALVAPGAELHASVEVGPYCVIGPEVRVDAGTSLRAHVVLEGRTTLGKNNRLHPFVTIGGEPQDVSYQAEPTEVLIGNGNTFREGATVHRGTVHGGGITRIGDGGLFMAYTHVAHDCQLGDRVIMCNCASLSGHVVVGTAAYLSGLCAVHQFCRLGTHCFVSGGAMVSRDVPPYCIAQGDRAGVVGINVVGLRRAGIPAERIRRLKRAFAAIFGVSGTLAPRLDSVRSGLDGDAPEVAELVAFFDQSRRGVCAHRRVEHDGL